MNHVRHGTGILVPRVKGIVRTTGCPDVAKLSGKPRQPDEEARGFRLSAQDHFRSNCEAHHSSIDRMNALQKAAAHAAVLHMPVAYMWRKHRCRYFSSDNLNGKDPSSDSKKADTSKGFSWRVNHMVSIPSSFSEKAKDGSVEETASWRFNHMVTTKRIASMKAEADKKMIEPSKPELVGTALNKHTKMVPRA
jgi:hypothetical protein